MSSALILAATATLGWGSVAELRRIEPNDLLAVAFVAQRSMEARLSIETPSPEAVALEIWYPPVPATRVPGVAGPSGPDARRDMRYTLSLPWFRSKP